MTSFEFEKVYNFRDFGERAACDGGAIGSGSLYRAAHLADATDRDMSILQTLGLDLLVDLRYRTERSLAPARIWSGFYGRILQNHADDEINSWRELVVSGSLSVDSVRQHNLDYYSSMPLAGSLPAIFGLAIVSILNAKGATLIFCTAGRDRTGVLAGLVLYALGVGLEGIIQDYLLSNDPTRVAEKIELAARNISAWGSSVPDRGVLEASVRVEPEYLLAAFGTINLRYGSIDNYLSKITGLAPFELKALRQSFLQSHANNI